QEVLGRRRGSLLADGVEHVLAGRGIEEAGDLDVELEISELERHALVDVLGAARSAAGRAGPEQGQCERDSQSSLARAQEGAQSIRRRAAASPPSGPDGVPCGDAVAARDLRSRGGPGTGLDRLAQTAKRLRPAPAPPAGAAALAKLVEPGRGFGPEREHDLG